MAGAEAFSDTFAGAGTISIWPTNWPTNNGGVMTFRKIALRLVLVSLATMVLASCPPAYSQDAGDGGAADGGAADGGINADTAASLRGAAGVDIDAAGVLRMKFFRDPTGQLTRRRLGQMKAELNPDVARVSKLRKMSLNRLEAVLANRIANGGQATQDMRYLAGLTRVRYLFCYPETQDIVIAGPAEGYGFDLSGRAIGLTSGRAVLELEDLIVALRAFAPAARPTRLISCSIDPTQDGLAQMQQFLVNTAGRIGPSDANRVAAGLRDNLGLQVVTIKGVPSTTHFAQVLVEADYRMKLIGIGLETPPVSITSYVKRANPASVSRNALQRWYFVPNYESVRASEDHLAMELVGDGVKLIGEDERVGADGSRVASGRVDRASKAFVTSFTNNYAELARRSPVFGQLRNVIDLAISAAFLQQEDWYAKTGWGLGLFAREDLFPIQAHNAPKQVESAVNVIWKGRTLMTPIGGGVHIEPLEALGPEQLLSDEGGELQKLHETVDIRQLAPDQWWWD
jgi:hypothetical protein